MSFHKFASCKIVESDKITLDNWRRQVVAASIKQDPKVVEASPAFDVDDTGFIYVRVRAVSAGEYHGCFPIGTSISLTDGTEIPIESVKVGDEVVTHTGKNGIVCQTYKRPYSGKMMHLSVAGLMDEISLTPEHPVYTVKGDVFKRAQRAHIFKRMSGIQLKDSQTTLLEDLHPEFIVAGEMKIGDRIYIPFSTEVVHTPELHPLDNDFAALLGYYASEGCLDRYSGERKKYKNFLRGVVFVFGPGDINAIERVKTIARRFGHIVTPVQNVNDAGIRVAVSWTDFAGVCDKHIGSKSQTKFLSKEIMTMPLEWQKNFLGAYLSGDGHFSRSGDRYAGSIKASTASKRLASDIQKLAARIGMVVSTSKRVQGKAGFGPKNNLIYELSCGASSVQDSEIWKYCDRFEAPPKRRSHSKIRIHNGYLISYVSGVSQTEFKDDVYNFEVTGDNSYVAKGIAVHNCNGNGDFFPEVELQENYKTFIRRGNYMNHQSDDISKAVGIILDAKYWSDPDTKYVECLLAVDKSEPIADKIAKGIADSVSMGAIVERCVCSVCEKEATNEGEYCDHLRNHMGREYNGRKVYAINRGVNFYELSWVSVPANNSAKLLSIVASMKKIVSTKWQTLTRTAKLNMLECLDSILEILSSPGH